MPLTYEQNSKNSKAGFPVKAKQEFGILKKIRLYKEIPLLLIK